MACQKFDRAAKQLLTRDWWEHRRHDFQLYTSQLVIVEASAGDEAAARLRLDSLKEIPWVRSTTAVELIATELEQRGLVPPNAVADAFHIAYASVHGIDYLLTWNCRHIANAERLPAIEAFLADRGLAVPIVCTPEELMGEANDHQ